MREANPIAGVIVAIVTAAVASTLSCAAAPRPSGFPLPPPHREPGSPPVVPLGLDLYVPAPDDNPITAAKVELGRRLFFDTRLSRDFTVACATCHHPERAFTDGRVTPRGVFGRIGTRNVPSLLNRAYGKRFFWDGRARTLEDQVRAAMAGKSDLDLPADEAATRLRGDHSYAAAFRETADASSDGRATKHLVEADQPGRGQGVTADRLVEAVATFVRAQLSADSAADRYAAGDTSALTPTAQRGRELFYGKARCGVCHAGPLFTDEDFHNTGVAWQDGELLDVGRFDVSGKEDDRGAFKTPTLREVARTAPYMHDGSLATLADVIKFYDRGGNPNPYLDAALRPRRLTSEEQQALITFLHALSGTGQDGIPPH